MTNHKQVKAQKRAKRKHKEIKIHKHSFRSTPSAGLRPEHPKPLSKGEILAQRRPIGDKPTTETPVPAKPQKPPSDGEAVKEPVPVGAGDKQ